MKNFVFSFVFFIFLNFFYNISNILQVTTAYDKEERARGRAKKIKHCSCFNNQLGSTLQLNLGL